MTERADEARMPAEQAPAWHDALAELERALDEARYAIDSLRNALASDDEASREQALSQLDREPPERPMLRTIEAADEIEGPSSAEVVAPADDVTREDELRADNDVASPADDVTREGDLRADNVVAPPADHGAAADGEAEAGEVLSPADESARLSAFERVWERIERERMERGSADGEETTEPREADQTNTAEDVEEKLRGLGLPQQYLMTVEDRENQVDLTSVHRALLTLADQQDISLVSFANGTPVISMRTKGEIDIDRLAEAVASGTNRACEVIEQGNGKLFLRLRPPKDPDGDRG